MSLEAGRDLVQSASGASVSVALCTYNGARYLKDQLDSIVAQTFPPYELVICDDRSTDETVAIVQAFSSHAPFPVRLFLNQTNRGSTKNFEQAIALCRGDIIALCDQDDIWHPAKLERAVAVFSSSPEVQAVFSDARIVDDQSRPLGLNLWDALGFTESRRRRFTRGEACAVLFKEPMVTGATLAFRSPLREAILPIPTEWVHDAWISLLIASLGRIEPIAEPLIDYRQHGAQQIGARERLTRRRRGWVSHALAEFSANPREYVRRFDAEYARYAREYEIAHDRLATLLPVHHPAVLGCWNKARHFRRRAGLSSRRWSRLPVVLRELALRRYGRYSSGYRGAAKDLLRAALVWV